LQFRNESHSEKLIIPNTPLTSLVPNLLYVYDTNTELFSTYSIVKAAKALNPDAKESGINVRGKEVARAKNKTILVKTQLGAFYFAENPETSRWKIYQRGRFPLILVDELNKTKTHFPGIKPVINYLANLLGKAPDYKLIKTHYEKELYINLDFYFCLIIKKNLHITEFTICNIYRI
jgi:hypothetical protein